MQSFLHCTFPHLYPFAFSHREKPGSSNPPCAYFFIQFPSMVLISWPQRLTQLWTCWTCQLYLLKHPPLALLNSGCASQLALTWHQPNTNLGDLGKLPLSTLKRSGWGKVCLFCAHVHSCVCVTRAKDDRGRDRYTWWTGTLASSPSTGWGVSASLLFCGRVPSRSVWPKAF